MQERTHFRRPHLLGKKTSVEGVIWGEIVQHDSAFLEDVQCRQPGSYSCQISHRGGKSRWKAIIAKHAKLRWGATDQCNKTGLNPQCLDYPAGKRRKDLLKRVCIRNICDQLGQDFCLANGLSNVRDIAHNQNTLDDLTLLKHCLCTFNLAFLSVRTDNYSRPATCPVHNIGG